jgi:hypothetical protein
MKNLIKILLMLLVTFSGLCQKLPINSPKVHEHIETEELASFITSNIKVDSTVKLQMAMIFLKVNKKGKVTFLNISGRIEDKFKKIINDRIQSPQTPWLKRNKINDLWYVFPICFGHIQKKYELDEIKWLILYQENNINSLRELENDNPNKVVILRTYMHLTNKGLQNFYD